MANSIYFVFFVFWKSSATRDWFCMGPLDREMAIDNSNDLRAYATELFVAMRNFDGTMSVIADEELTEDD